MCTGVCDKTTCTRRKVNSKKPTSSNRAGARKLNPEWCVSTAFPLQLYLLFSLRRRDAFVADLARAQATMIRACEDHRLKSVISGNLNR